MMWLNDAICILVARKKQPKPLRLRNNAYFCTTHISTPIHKTINIATQNDCSTRKGRREHRTRPQEV